MAGRLIVFLGVIVLLHAMYYLYYYFLAKRYSNIYTTYITEQDAKSSDKLSAIKHQVKHLFRVTGIHGYRMPYVEAIGLGTIAKANISPVDNIDNLREDVVSTLVRQFDEAVGTCKSKFIHSFSPIYWFDLILYMPSKLFSYLGLKSDKSIVRFAQLIWWIIGAVALVIGIVFNKEFTTWFNSRF